MQAVPLPWPLAGDSRTHPTNRNNPILDPRKPQNPCPEILRTYHTDTKNHNSAQIRSRIEAVTNISENLLLRLQSLKNNLAVLESKTKRILVEIFKEPPDPDPPVPPGVHTNDEIKEAREGREESAPKMPHARLELQVFKDSNLRCEEDCFEVQERLLKGGNGFQFHHSTSHHSIHHSNLHTRCSLFCPMATNGGQSGLAPVAEKMNSLSVGCLTEGVHRRPAKEIAESSKVGGKCVLVVDMAGARKQQGPRFLAIGLFLSVLLVNSKQLIEHMKRVWKVRGDMEASTIESESRRKFIIHFSEEGDLKHAVIGGPWQYKGDAFLVEGLAAGADPSSALFTHVPMWVQFRNIPFYLLTKKLAHDLGECIGTTLKIDESARGSIDEKFIRTRIQLPLYKALQSEISLSDEISGEEVVVQVRYERLPNFCLFCGFIGHMEARCDVPKEGRKIRFNLDLRVRAVHFEDPRRWFLPNKMGKNQQHPPPLKLWRAPEPVNGEQCSVFGDVNLVQEVAKLSVADKSTPVNVASDSIEKGSNSSDEEQGLEDESTKNIKVGKGGTWKRKNRVIVSDQSKGSDTPRVTQLSGNVRGREKFQDEDMEVEPATKKCTILATTQSEGLENEVLVEKKEENGAEQQADSSELKGSGTEIDGSTGGKAATGPGATGNLSGANVSARQEP